MIPAIKKRLVSQLKARGKSPEAAYAIAQSALSKSGNVDKSGNATAKGKKRGSMTPAQRSNDRASKYRGGKPSNFKYKASNNTSLKITKR